MLGDEARPENVTGLSPEKEGTARGSLPKMIMASISKIMLTPMVTMETFKEGAPRASRGRTMTLSDSKEMMMQIIEGAGYRDEEGKSRLSEEGVHGDSAHHRHGALAEEEHLRRAQGDDEP